LLGLSTVRLVWVSLVAHSSAPFEPRLRIVQPGINVAIGQVHTSWITGEI
jgi:hypothetical protein